MSNANMPANPVKGCDDRFIDDNEMNDSWIENCKPSIGLTKREAFAMAAMQNILTQYNPFEQGDFDSSNYEEVAINSVGLADALLKELDK